MAATHAHGVTFDNRPTLGYPVNTYIQKTSNDESQTSGKENHKQAKQRNKIHLAPPK